MMLRRRVLFGGAALLAARSGAVSGDDAPLSVFIAVDGKSTGPFGEEELAKRLKSRADAMAIYVWMEGMTDWAPASEVPALEKLLRRLPAVASFDLFAFLVGRWTTSGNTVGKYTVNSVLTIGRDLKYKEVNDYTENAVKRTKTGTMPLSYHGTRTVTGTWKAYDVSRTRINLYLEVKDSTSEGDAKMPKAVDMDYQFIVEGDDTMRSIYGPVYRRQPTY